MSSSTVKVREIPRYPGPLPKKAPEPPKYLVQVVESENGPKHQIVQLKGTAPPIRPKGLAEPEAPVMAKYARIFPQRDHETPAHFYPPRQQYVPPEMKKKPIGKTKNSLVDVKSSSPSVKEGEALTLPALPKLPSVPRPYVPPSKTLYVGGPLMHARNAAGEILGTGSPPGSLFFCPLLPSPSYMTILIGTTRYVPSENVPYLDRVASAKSTELTESPDVSSVGPSNPVLQLNDLWSACWDDEAGAIYYYNQETGEATWLPPF
jgi:hypothetical protein